MHFFPSLRTRNKLLRNVTIGNAMYPPMPPDSSGSPTLIYVDENTPPVKFESPSKPTKDAHAICMAGESEGVAAFVATRLPYIIICPDFFNSRPALPSSKSCPRITSQGTAFQRNKRLEPDYAGQRMMESQIWILLEEIVHYYLDFHWPTVQGPEPEVRDINRAWGLDAALSLGNAQSYAYYAATLHGKCNRWPTKPADDGRELREVEIDPDGPSVVGVCADQATEMPEDVVEVAEVEITGDMTEVTI